MIVMILLIAFAMMAVYIMSIILEWAIFKRIMNVRTHGVIASCAASTLLGLFFFAMNTEGWGLAEGIIPYTVGGGLCTIARLLAGRGTEKWLADRDEAGKLKDTFE